MEPSAPPLAGAYGVFFDEYPARNKLLAMVCSRAVGSSALTSVVECESDRVCCQLVAPGETAFEVVADVVPDLWTAIAIRRRLIRRRFVIRRLVSRRLISPKVKTGVRGRVSGSKAEPNVRW